MSWRKYRQVADKCNSAGCESCSSIASRISTGQHSRADGSSGIHDGAVLEVCNIGDGEGNDTDNIREKGLVFFERAKSRS